MCFLQHFDFVAVHAYQSSVKPTQRKEPQRRSSAPLPSLFLILRKCIVCQSPISPIPFHIELSLAYWGCHSQNITFKRLLPFGYPGEHWLIYSNTWSDCFASGQKKKKKRRSWGDGEVMSAGLHSGGSPVSHWITKISSLVFCCWNTHADKWVSQQHSSVWRWSQRKYSDWCQPTRKA